MKREAKQPDILIEDISSPNKEDWMARFQSGLDRHENDLKFQGKLLNWAFGFIVAILVVCFIAFVTFLLDAWRFHAESYKKFTDTIKAQEQLIQKNK